MDEVRKKQQERYEAAARVMAERERVKEEEKRRQKMEELENLVNECFLIDHFKFHSNFWANFAI